MICTSMLAMLAAATPAIVATPAATPRATVAAYIAAQHDFDATALAALTTPDFVEISPVGEVDRRDAVLGFYAPDKRVAAPTMVVSEETERQSGDTAIVTLRLSFGPGAMRAVYVARRVKTGWALMSAQYTPIREANRN